MSKRFDGVLLCTDFDGTLAYGGKITKANADAIRHFQEEGGVFTVVSGRFPSFIGEHRDDILPNAPICGMNGACIADAITGQTLYEAPMEPKAVCYAVEMLKYLPGVTDLQIQTKTGCFQTQVVDGLPLIAVPNAFDDIYKILFIVSDEASDEATALLRREAEGLYAVSRSWRNGLEIQCHGTDKGSAVRFLNEWFGGRITYTVGVGDYENDIPLLLAADQKVAEQDAIPAIKAIADWITTSCREDSIAKIIEVLRPCQ